MMPQPQCLHYRLPLSLPSLPDGCPLLCSVDGTVTLRGESLEEGLQVGEAVLVEGLQSLQEVRVVEGQGRVLLRGDQLGGAAIRKH